MADERTVGGDDELDFGEMSGEPEANAPLPGGMKMGVYLVDEHDSRVLDGHETIRSGGEQSGTVPRGSHLPEQFESEAEDGAEAISKDIDRNRHAIAINEADPFGVNTFKGDSLRQKSFLIDELFDSIEKRAAALFIVQLFETQLAEPSQAFSQGHIFTKN